MTVTLKNGQVVTAGLVESVDDIKCAKVFKHKTNAYVHFMEVVLIYSKTDNGWKLNDVRMEGCV